MDFLTLWGDNRGMDINVLGEITVVWILTLTFMMELISRMMRYHVVFLCLDSTCNAELNNFKSIKNIIYIYIHLLLRLTLQSLCIKSVFQNML